MAAHIAYVYLESLGKIPGIIRPGKIPGSQNSCIPKINAKLPDLLFESGLRTKNLILTTHFRKNEILVYRFYRLYYVVNVVASTQTPDIRQSDAGCRVAYLKCTAVEIYDISKTLC